VAAGSVWAGRCKAPPFGGRDFEQTREGGPFFQVVGQCGPTPFAQGRIKLIMAGPKAWALEGLFGQAVEFRFARGRAKAEFFGRGGKVAGPDLADGLRDVFGFTGETASADSEGTGKTGCRAADQRGRTRRFSKGPPCHMWCRRKLGTLILECREPTPGWVAGPGTRATKHPRASAWRDRSALFAKNVAAVF